LAKKFHIESGIQPHPPLLTSVLFDFHKTPTSRTILFRTLAVVAYVALVDYLETYVLHVAFKPPYTIFYLVGLVLGWLLVFRTYTAYDRWWKGRAEISYLSNNAKNLSSKLNAYLPKDDMINREFFAKMIANHAYAMKETLRYGVRFDELIETIPGELADLKKVYHVPSEISSQIMIRLNELFREKKLTFPQFWELHKYIDMMVEVVGNCERIRTSPMPAAYRIHLKKFILFFALISPFYFVQEINLWSMLIIGVIFYAMSGLEAIGEEIEDPFGQDENDLPIDFVCNSIEKYASINLKVELRKFQKH
jgi:ion channel-forming bestrophin family protein